MHIAKYLSLLGCLKGNLKSMSQGQICHYPAGPCPPKSAHFPLCHWCHLWLATVFYPCPSLVLVWKRHPKDAHLKLSHPHSLPFSSSRPSVTSILKGLTRPACNGPPCLSILVSLLWPHRSFLPMLHPQPAAPLLRLIPTIGHLQAQALSPQGRLPWPPGQVMLLCTLFSWNHLWH